NLAGDTYRVMSLRTSAGGASPIVELLIRERAYGLMSYLIGYIAAAVLALLTSTRRVSDPVFLWATAVAAAVLLVSPVVLLSIGRLAGARTNEGSRSARVLVSIHRSLDFGSPVFVASLVGVSLV